ncbi:hypothetical protein NPIL_560981 [Nephila pilipes]|uniref:Endonuclease/exonuclease/phosphatase domain-containing protein n=1 Tax=Nephila pilipes TaxID=299642 RepID=A0A8X6NZP4_NEPPI|nr:hypothetical protein NPIL_560981 [Nephila pilipes]
MRYSNCRRKCNSASLPEYPNHNIGDNRYQPGKGRCQNYGIDILAPNKPAYYSINKHYQPSTMDLGLAKGIQNFSVSTSEDLSSDHNPVYFLVSLDNITSQPQNQILLIK